MLKFTAVIMGLALASAPSICHAQSKAHFGVKAGANRAILDGVLNEEPSYRLAPHGGVFLNLRASRAFALQPELLISSQGVHTERTYRYDTETYNLKSDTKLTYLAVPVLAKAYIGSMFYLEAGPQLGLLIGGKEKRESVYYINSGPEVEVRTVTEDAKKNYKSDVAACGGLGVDFKNGLVVGARLNYGFTDINNNAERQQLREQLGIGGLHNRVMQFSVGYLFGKE